MCDGEDVDGTTLAQINAGVLNYDANTRLLTPDTRKGVLKVVVNAEEAFSLVWRPRGEEGTVQPEYSLALRPPKKVEVSKIKGQRAVSVRVDGAKKAFFWIQEAGDESGDTEPINEINESIVTAIEMSSSSSSLEPAEALSHPHPSQQQQGPMSTEELSRVILTAMNEMPAAKKDLKLNKVLCPSKVIEILLDPKNKNMLEGLYQYMPESTRTPEGMRELLLSAQFYRDAKILEAMIKSGSAGSIMTDFKMNMSAQGPYGGVRKFLEELIRVSKKK